MLPPSYAGDDPQQAVKFVLQRLFGGTAFPLEAITSGTSGGELAFDGPFYRLRSPGRVAKRIAVPTFVTGGWYDLFQRGTPRLYDALPLPSGRKKLLMGPWYHVTGARGAGLGERGAPPPLDVLALAWFERWARGKRNGIGRYGPVVAKQLNTKRWEVYRSYPRRDVRYRRFHLGDRVLTDRPPKASGANAMPANQLAGLCTRSTTQWTAGIDQLIAPGQPCTSHNELNEAGALTYTTAPLRKPLHLSGPLALNLSGATTAKDTTWVVTVSDVSPSGQSNQITAGWLVQSRRALDRRRSTYGPRGELVAPFHPFTKASVLPVKPGRTDRMAIEVFNTDAVLPKGHRLRVTIASGDVPHMMVAAPDAVNGVGAVNTVRFGRKSPSFLTVGVAPLGAEPRH
jgi:hypothetical protein